MVVEFMADTLSRPSIRGLAGLAPALINTLSASSSGDFTIVRAHRGQLLFGPVKVSYAKIGQANVLPDAPLPAVSGRIHHRPPARTSRMSTETGPLWTP